jgi:hypothetical protein
MTNNLNKVYFINLEEISVLRNSDDLIGFMKQKVYSLYLKRSIEL